MWTLVWVALVLGALGVLFLLGRSLFRKGVALARELGDASERLSAVSEGLAALQRAPEQPEDPAIFADPARLRAERFVARRGVSRGTGRGTARGAGRGGARGAGRDGGQGQMRGGFRAST